MFLRIKAYAPNGASLGVMPSPLKVSASLPMNDHGALSMEYGLAAPKPDALASPCEFAVEVSRDGSTWTEPRNARFLYLRRGGDDLKQPARIQAEGLGYAWRLQTAKVLPINDGRADGKRAFLSQNPGTILRALIMEAQSRGALQGLTYDFSHTADSAGNAWSDKLTIYYEPGIDLLTIIRNLADQGVVDFWTEGRTLRVFNSESAASARRLEVATPSAIVLREGRDMTEAPYKGTWENMANYAYIRGDEGVSLEKVQNAVMPWGRQEVFITNGGVSDEGTMNLLADSSLALASEERVERTFGLTLSEVPFLPMLDYAPGDYVGVRLVGKGQAAYRCRQVTLERDAQASVSGNVVLNDRFMESEVRQNRRVQGITNGAQSSGGSGSQPSAPPAAPDETPPAVPTNGTVSTETYTTPQGDDRAVAHLSWAEVVTNYNGSPTKDVERYEVRWKSAVASPAGTPQTLTPATAHAALNALWDRRGKAWGWVGGDGAASIRKPDGRDLWLFGDSTVGQIGTDWKLVKGQPWGMVNNALVETNPADRSEFRTLIGAPNLLTADVATLTRAYVAADWSQGNSAGAIVQEPMAYAGRALELRGDGKGTAYTFLAYARAKAAGALVAVQPGETITVQWKARAGTLTAARGAQAYLYTYTSAGAGAGVVSGSYITVPADGSVVSGVVKLTIPANAAYASPMFGVAGPVAGDSVRFFDLGLYRGDQLHSSWSLPMGHAYEAVARPEATGWKATDYQNGAPNLNRALRTTSGEKRVVMLGDSITEGVGPTALGTSWTRLFQNLLRSEYDAGATGAGYIPAMSSAFANGGQTYSNPAPEQVTNRGGLASLGVVCDSGEWVQWPATDCDSITVYYAGLDFFPGTLQVLVDGVVKAERNVAASTFTSGLSVTVNVPAGSHTVRVQGKAGGGGCFVEGVLFRKGQNGVYALNGGHSGYTFRYLLDGDQAKAQWQAIRAAQPHAGVVVLGSNDTVNRTAAQFASDALEFVNRWRTETGGLPVTVGVWPEPQSATATTPYSAYVDAVRSSLGNVAGVDVVDLGAYLPRAADNTSPKWLVDGVHPNDTGSTMVAKAMFDRLQDATADYYWMGDGWTYGGKIYALCQIVGPYWPTPSGWNFTYKGRTDVARWNASTLKLESVQPFATSPVSWTDAAYIEGSWLYVWGHLADGSACLARVPVATPYAGLTAWDGSTWNADTSKAVALVQGRTISSVRRIGSTYRAYYVDGVNVKEATASTLTGPWTLTTTPVYRMPEVGGKNYAYIPRQHPQFDGPSGLVFGYSQNTNADWLNGPDGLSHVGPRFAKGPASTPTAPNMDNVAWQGSTSTTDTTANVSPLQPGAAFYAEVRAIDQAGNASANAAKVEAWAPIGPTVTGSNTTPPNRTSAPVVSAFFQGVTVYWDGLDYTGGEPASSWRRVEVHVSAVDSFYPSASTYVGELPETGGTLPVHGLQANVPYFARLVSVDKRGNRGEPSDQGTATTAQLVNADLPDKLVEAANVADGAISVRNLNVAGWSDSLAPNLDYEGDWVGSTPYGWVPGWWIGDGDTAPTKVTGSESVTGGTSWRHTVRPGNGRIWRGPVVPVQERVIYYWSIRIKTSRAVTDGLDFALAYGATPDEANGWARLGLTNGPIRNDDGTTTFYGRGEMPAGMKYAAPVLILYPETGQASPYTVTVGGVEFKQIVGGANIAEASIQNAHISYLDLNVGNVSTLNAGRISTGTMSALVTLSGEFRTQDGRWRAGSYGARTYDASGSVVTEMRSSDGGLVSRWFRTNTAGARIEMGTYGMGAGSALISFFSDSSVWQFPPAFGFGGGSRTNFPGLGIHAGSVSASAYGQYGMNFIGVDQKGGIQLLTGNKLDSTQASDGAPITLNAGGSKGSVNIYAGTEDDARLVLKPGFRDGSLLSLPGGVLKFSNVSSDSLQIFNSTAWAGLDIGHMGVNAYGGFRVVTGADASQSFIVRPNGLIDGSGAWGVPKIKVRAQDSYISWDSNGNAYVDGKGVKSFVIDHPDDEARRLVHACVEMPEARVAYEGASSVDAGVAEFVELPAYFPSLTVEGSDVVTVTPHLCNVHGAYCPGRLISSRVDGGELAVHLVGAQGCCRVEFSWRVSAVRRGTEFTVEPLKAETRVHGDGPYTYLT